MINKIKSKLNDMFNYDYFIINDKACMGYFGKYRIFVESNDTNPPHFRVKLNDKYITRIRIPFDYVSEPCELVYSNLDKKLNFDEECSLLDWMRQSNVYFKICSNLEALQCQWNSLHPNDEVGWD